MSRILGNSKTWWRGAALYQVYPRSFADSNGDGIGDLAGITAHLDHIADLGVGGVWISPFFPSPMRDFGYDVSDYCDVDPMFGTLADFDMLIARAHARNLRVVIDQVWSHTAMEHTWFQESRSNRENPKSDWYVWADARPDGAPPNNWLSWMGGPAWRWEPRRRQYHLHNFLPQMPDLNFHCAAVQEVILDVAKFWLQKGVDGFRLDTANLYFHSRGLENNPPSVLHAEMPVLMQLHQHNTDQPETLDFLERLRALLDHFNAFAVGEIGGSDPMKTMVEYTAGSQHLHTAYSFAMLGERPMPETIAQHMADWQKGDAAHAWPSWAFSNHDAVRVASRWGTGGDAGFAFGGGQQQQSQSAEVSPALWMALLIALRGTVFIYQGEELGLTQAEISFEQLQDPFGQANWPLNKGRDGCRTPLPWCADETHAGFSYVLPWLPIPADHRKLAVDAQHAVADSTLQITRRLLALRRKHAALRVGDFQPLQVDECLLIASRHVGDETLMVAFNLSPTRRVASVPRGDSLFSLAGAKLDGDSLQLPPWSCLFSSIL
jgi:alpha-glucosidase